MNQLKVGAVLSYLSIVITIIVAILYTPVLIRVLGQSEYGLYTLIGSFAAYVSILDLGLGNAIVRYNARNRAVGDKEEESKLNGMFMKMFLFIAVITIIIGCIFYCSVDNIFGSSLTSDELNKAKIMIIILVFNYTLSFPLAVFGSIMQAYERFIIIKTISIIRSIAIPLITLPVIFLGYGAVAMVVITTIVNLLTMGINTYYSLVHINIKFNFGKVDPNLLKEILGYSFFVFLGVVVDQIYWNTDQLILGAIVGTVPVAVYGIALQFIRLYREFSTSISGMFLPKTSMMIANNASGKELTDHMIRYGRVQYLIISFICSGFIIFGLDFINIWAGTDYGNAYYITIIIMIPLTIPLIQNFGISVLYAKNKQKFRSIILIIIAIINVIITIPLVIKYEAIGAAIATAVSLSLGNIIAMNIYYHLKIELNMIRFWKDISKMSIPLLSAILIGYLTHNYLLATPTILFFLIHIMIYSILHFIIMWLFMMNNYERRLLSAVLMKFKKLIKR